MDQSSINEPIDSDDFPPFSRLFVHYEASTSLDQLTTLFQQFGNVENVKQLRDPETNESRGLFFVKFSKASSSALAMEQLHGTSFLPGLKNMKIQFADFKGAPRGSSKTDGEVPPFSRLFVTYKRSMTEQDLKNWFSVYGNVEAIRILKDRKSGKPRGMAFVKFDRTSSAFTALEDSNETDMLVGNLMEDQRIRCRIAYPQPLVSAAPLTPEPHSFSATLPVTYPAGCTTSSSALLQAATHTHAPTCVTDMLIWKNPALGKTRVDNNNPPESRLFISFTKFVHAGYIQMLLAPFGDLHSVHILPGRTCGFAKFATASQAAAAMDALNGKEVAPNCFATIMIAESQRSAATQN